MMTDETTTTMVIIMTKLLLLRRRREEDEIGRAETSKRKLYTEVCIPNVYKLDVIMEN